MVPHGIQNRQAVRNGVIAGAAAYLWWGLGPLYFKLLIPVPSTEIVCHRIVWSAILLGVLITIFRIWPEAIKAIRSPRTAFALAVTGILVASNWLVYIYAISHGRVLDASLGYFTNPLFCMVLGYVFLHERIGRMQTGAIIIALAALIYLAAVGAKNGIIPWIPLALATSFGFYGLLRKQIAVSPTIGTFIETCFLFPVAAGWIVRHTRELGGSTSSTSLADHKLLFFAGVVTTVPLLLFTTAAKRLRLMTVGFLQYLCPTCQFLLAVAVYHEPFRREYAVTFSLIWLALALYSFQSFKDYRRESDRSRELIEAEVELIG